MHARAIVLTAACSILAAGCSGGSAATGQPALGPAPPAGSLSQALQRVPPEQRLGGAPGSWGLAHIEVAPRRQHAQTAPDAIPRDLYVSDLGVRGIIIFANKSYREIGTITSGTSAADGVWVDQLGNLYAANADGQNVTEYAPHATAPTCTYTGLADPIGVTTDTTGHVFVVDWNNASQGSVVEYMHCKNAVVRRYQFASGSAPHDVAVDASGNVFVSYYTGSAGALEEFVAGSKNPKPLGATTVFPGGMVIDKKGNLIVADQGVAGQSNGSIDVVAPPYTTATPVLTGLAQPFHESLDKRESELYVTSFDFNVPTVWVMSYPSISIKQTLGSSNGLAYPLGAAHSPDAVLWLRVAADLGVGREVAAVVLLSPRPRRASLIATTVFGFAGPPKLPESSGVGSKGVVIWETPRLTNSFRHPPKLGE